MSKSYLIGSMSTDFVGPVLAWWGYKGTEAVAVRGQEINIQVPIYSFDASGSPNARDSVNWPHEVIRVVRVEYGQSFVVMDGESWRYIQSDSSDPYAPHYYQVTGGDRRMEAAQEVGHIYQNTIIEGIHHGEASCLPDRDQV